MIFRSHLSRDFRGHLGISREFYMQRAGNCTVSAYVQAGNYTCSAQGNCTGGELYRQRALTDNFPRSKFQHFLV